jgi:energy-converting hydrogenase Eha subunit F
MRPIEELLGFETFRKVRNLYSKIAIPTSVTRIVSISVVIVIILSILVCHYEDDCYVDVEVNQDVLQGR